MDPIIADATATNNDANTTDSIIEPTDVIVKAANSTPALPENSSNPIPTASSDVTTGLKRSASLTKGKTKKRTTNLDWNDYFMAVACLTAQRSKDPSTQVGACIVNKQNKIVGVGYNGLPRGVHDDLIPWDKEGPYTQTKYAYVVHAELNAILNCTNTDQTDCTIYVSLFPCNECAKSIIQSGIKRVVYLSDKHHNKEATKASKTLFKMANVKFEMFEQSAKVPLVLTLLPQ